MDLGEPQELLQNKGWGLTGGGGLGGGGQLDSAGGSSGWNNGGPQVEDCDGDGDDAFTAGLKQISGQQPHPNTPTAGAPP